MTAERRSWQRTSCHSTQKTDSKSAHDTLHKRVARARSLKHMRQALFKAVKRVGQCVGQCYERCVYRPESRPSEAVLRTAAARWRTVASSGCVHRLYWTSLQARFNGGRRTSPFAGHIDVTFLYFAIILYRLPSITSVFWTVVVQDSLSAYILDLPRVFTIVDNATCVEIFDWRHHDGYFSSNVSQRRMLTNCEDLANRSTALQ